MWSASQKYGFSQCSACTAASAAWRTDEGSEPMIVCSRFDLFQTGMTSTPFCKATSHACNSVLGWCPNLAPTPTEYLPSLRGSCATSALFRHSALNVMDGVKFSE